MKTKLALAALALATLALCSCQQAPAKAAFRPPPVTPTAGVSTTIYLDQPSTYPPMPAGQALYVDNITGRTHYRVVVNIASVGAVGKHGTIGNPAAATVILFTDSTGLVLTSRATPLIQQGPVQVQYSTPPDMPYQQATVVLVHSLK